MAASNNDAAAPPGEVPTPPRGRPANSSGTADSSGSGGEGIFSVAIKLPHEPFEMQMTVGAPARAIDRRAHCP